MKCWVDLHIHSCLSPCADEDMTPNNIVNMAVLKGLDIIAVTDHNSAQNAKAVLEAGQKAGIIVITGMELCTAEEIHLVCLFPSLSKTLSFERIVYEHLPAVQNREDIFGTQIIMNALDQEIGREPRLLSGACSLDVQTAISCVRSSGGVVIPAHIDRGSFSMLRTLGTIPSEYNFRYLEHSKNCRPQELIQKHPELEHCHFIYSSDAHFLPDILEQEVCLEINNRSIDALFAFLG